MYNVLLEIRKKFKEWTKILHQNYHPVNPSVEQCNPFFTMVVLLHPESLTLYTSAKSILNWVPQFVHDLLLLPANVAIKRNCSCRHKPKVITSLICSRDRTSTANLSPTAFRLKQHGWTMSIGLLTRLCNGKHLVNMSQTDQSIWRV